MMKIDPSKTSVCIIANPDLRVTPELLLWLLDSGVPRNNILVHRGNDRDQVAAYNSVVEMSLKLTSVTHHLFADADIRPYEASDCIWEAPHDFTCLKCDTEVGLASWNHKDSFHTGLWVARSAALRQMKAPWFGWTYNAAHSQIHGCVCESFRESAASLGLTTGNVGHAHHYPRGSKLPDSICVKTWYAGKAR